MTDIFRQAFDASGDPEVGRSLGMRVALCVENWHRKSKRDTATMAEWNLARQVLGEVRRFAEENQKPDGKPAVISPTVHLNGTGKNSLAEDYDNAREAVRKAMEQIQQIEFNARDYYVQGDGAWEQACAEMKERLLSLQRVSDELLAIMEGIDKQ